MKKTRFSMAATLIMVFCVCIGAHAQDPGKFGSSIEKSMGPKKIRVPYTDVVSYLGYAAPGTEDEVKDGKKFYYIYIWIPAVAPELGVRMMSPAGDVEVKDPIVADTYEANKASEDFFDTYITLERSTIASVDDVTAEKAAAAKWFVLAKNDDSGEMPKQPSGSKFNSLLRYESETGDPLKALSVGLYRVGFTTYKTGEVKGTFLAQVASPIALPGVAMAKTVEEVAAQLKK